MAKTGLTLGKFAPLHKGHQFVIETMLQENENGIVIIYDTDVIDVPLRMRAEWIRKLYPQVQVIEAWDGPSGYSLDRQYQILEEEYIQSLLGGIKIDQFYSSEFYGEHVAKSLGAKDRRVDDARKIVPISATMIRENPYRYREYISDLVYRDLIVKIVFVGAMSTGKSTITEALAQRYHTVYSSEYGRDYWAEHQVDRRISFDAFDEIGKGHLEREEEQIQKANKYIFIDTNAITTYVFSLDYHGKAPAYLSQLALENAGRYDLFFLCEDDIPYDDTWDRSGDQKRKIFHQQVIQDLQMRKIPYISLKGSLEQRMEKVDEVLKEFTPYNNFYGKDY